MSWALLPLTEEQREIQRLAREFAQTEIVPYTAAWDRDAHFERSVIARDELRKLQKILDDLPSRTRSVMIMRRVEGLSRDEIAQQLGVSEVTVKWHLNEGLRALADALYGAQFELRGRR